MGFIPAPVNPLIKGVIFLSKVAKLLRHPKIEVFIWQLNIKQKKAIVFYGLLMQRFER